MSTSIDNFTVSEVNWQISTGEEIPNTVLTLTPNAGYFLDANNFSATTSSPVSNIYFTQSGDNVSMTVEFDSTPVVSDLAIPICMNGRSDLIVFTLQVDYNYSVLNASASLPPVTINREGIYDSVSNIFTNATFTADTDYYFLNTPTCVVSVGDPNNYTISNTKTYDTNSNLIGISFTAQYTFPSINVSGDLISINASAVALPTQAPIQVRSYSFLNSEFSSDGETRRFSVFGTQGANWTLTVNNGATPSTYSSVVPSGGQDFLDINIPVGFGVDYTFTLTGDLISPFPQSNPFTISQAADIPVLQTTEITNITNTTADSGGYNILPTLPITQKGVEWSETSTFDTITGSTNEGSGDSDFTSNITVLSKDTYYYVRAYATNSLGTGYGQVVEFLTTNFAECGSTVDAGGPGIQDIGIELNPSGGLLAFLVWASTSYPDKFEIFHGAADPTFGTTIIANKKATSGSTTDGNSGPFDNVYGTSNSYPLPPAVSAPDTGVANPNGGVFPTELEADGVPQFIDASTSPPTRQAEFEIATNGYYDVPSMSVGGTDYQQVLWWVYSPTDYNISDTAILRVTAPHDVSTVWKVLRLCCPDSNCVELPTIVTKGISNETGSAADSGGENITDGGNTILSKGIQWSEFADFSTILSANNEGTGTADFNSTMTGLTVGNTYYVRAYAQSAVGIGYGQVIEFVSNITVPCNSIATPGGEGINDLNINLDSGGGLIAIAVAAGGIVDKFEIIHGGPGGTKVATSGMTTANAGPFDNTYGTETSNTVPTNTQAGNVDQFIGTAKGVPPTRETEFTDETGYIADMGGRQQLLWWQYDAADFQIASNVTIRVTGPSDTSTGWNFLRLCCPDSNCTLPPSP